MTHQTSSSNPRLNGKYDYLLLDLLRTIPSEAIEEIPSPLRERIERRLDYATQAVEDGKVQKTIVAFWLKDALKLLDTPCSLREELDLVLSHFDEDEEESGAAPKKEPHLISNAPSGQLD